LSLLWSLWLCGLFPFSKIDIGFQGVGGSAENRPSWHWHCSWQIDAKKPNQVQRRRYMKHSWKLFAVMAIFPIAAMAQTNTSASNGNLDAEVNAELEKMYKEQSASSAAQAAQAATPAPAAAVATAPAATATTAAPAANAAAPAAAAVVAAPAAAPAPVVQTQTVVAPVAVAPAAATATTAAVAAPAATAANSAAGVQAVKQPTTVIEASPLVESGADKLRKAREEAEVNTEQKIVEKLEQSRLDDEKKRADVLFGDKFNQMNNQQQAAAPVATQAVVAPTAAAADADKKDEKIDRDAVRGEVKAALDEMKAQAQTEEKPKPQNYIGVLGGGGSYPDAKNVRGQGSLGVSFGRKFDDRLVVEGSFLYSNYQVEQMSAYGYCAGGVVDPLGNCYPRITNMNQYAGQALIKYQLLSGTFRPEIGALAAYTYRTFSDTQFSMSNSSASSNALDAGVMAGVSLELTQKFSVGFDFRYMWNMAYKTSGLQQSFQQTFMDSTAPIETMNYYTANIVGRGNF
jgi:hypothetical protein